MGAAASITSLNEVNTEDICQMLISMDLPQYVDYIRENNINGQQLSWFQDTEDLLRYLNEIGINDEEHQGQVANLLIKLKAKNIDDAGNVSEVQGSEPVNMHSAFLSVEALTTELQNDATGERIEERGIIDGFGSGFTPLMAACYYGNLDVAITLMDLGADVNSVSIPDQTTALMLAAVTGNIDIATALLDREVDVNAASKDGWTALMFACSNQFIPLASLLVDRGASTELRNSVGSNALNLIIEEADKQTFQVVLDAKLTYE